MKKRKFIEILEIIKKRKGKEKYKEKGNITKEEKLMMIIMSSEKSKEKANKMTK